MRHVEQGIMAKASVIIPTFNGCRKVQETIVSVLEQSERDLEIVIVDDGSTDNTAEVVRAYSDMRVRYFHKPNGGPASARNYGLSRASGDYVAFLDHDDLWPANFLEVMISALEANPSYGLAYAPITVTYEDGRRVTSYKQAGGKSGWLAADLFQHSFVWTSSAVMRRSVVEHCRYDESLRRSYEDGDFFLRLSAQVRYLFVPDVQAVKIEHAGNLSREVGVQPTRILVLERFYSDLGGNRFIPASAARRRLSHACRTVAEEKTRRKARAAAVSLYKRAISYWPVDVRLYVGLGKALLLPPRRDTEPDWHMPEPLPRV
jgi:glycosyltransferase involved in cell wall biosynthesis